MMVQFHHDHKKLDTSISFYYFQEMQSQMNILNAKQQMPDMAELITSMFGGGTKKTTKSKPSKRRS